MTNAGKRGKIERVIFVKLYKNVDIADLASILEKGLLPLDKLDGDGGWISGNRARNSTAVVYLFDPLTEQNYFHEYGAALLEVDVDAERSEIPQADRHGDKYVEYITPTVRPDQITAVYVPAIFADVVPEEVKSRVKFCDLRGEHWNGEKLTAEQIKTEIDQANPAAVFSTGIYMYFRGKDERGDVTDFYNLHISL